jgi:hypothetical protein
MVNTAWSPNTPVPLGKMIIEPRTLTRTPYGKKAGAGLAVINVDA